MIPTVFVTLGVFGYLITKIALQYKEIQLLKYQLNELRTPQTSTVTQNPPSVT